MLGNCAMHQKFIVLRFMSRAVSALAAVPSLHSFVFALQLYILLTGPVTVNTRLSLCTYLHQFYLHPQFCFCVFPLIWARKTSVIHVMDYQAGQSIFASKVIEGHRSGPMIGLALHNPCRYLAAS